MLLWHERDGVSVLVGGPSGVSKGDMLHVAESLQERRDEPPAPLAFLVSEVPTPDRFRDAYGPTLRVAARPASECISYDAITGCLPLAGTGPVRVFAAGHLPLPLLIANVDDNVARVELEIEGGARHEVPIVGPGEPFHGERFVVQDLDLGTIPRAVVAYGRDGAELGRVGLGGKPKGYTAATSGTTSGIAWRLSYKRTPSDFCVAIRARWAAVPASAPATRASRARRASTSRGE